MKKSDGCWFSSTGISPLQVFLPALLIACDALNARTMTVGEYHYPNWWVIASNLPQLH